MGVGIWTQALCWCHKHFTNWALFPAPTLYSTLLKHRVQKFLDFKGACQEWGQMIDPEYFRMETLMQGTRWHGMKLKIRYRACPWGSVNRIFRKVRTRCKSEVSMGNRVQEVLTHVAWVTGVLLSLKPQGWVLGLLVWRATQNCLRCRTETSYSLCSAEASNTKC